MGIVRMLNVLVSAFSVPVELENLRDNWESYPHQHLKPCLLSELDVLGVSMQAEEFDSLEDELNFFKGTTVTLRSLQHF